MIALLPSQDESSRDATDRTALNADLKHTSRIFNDRVAKSKASSIFISTGLLKVMITDERGIRPKRKKATRKDHGKIRVIVEHRKVHGWTRD